MLLYLLPQKVLRQILERLSYRNLIVLAFRPFLQIN
ncbi:F-box protein [uncultured Psychrosphaera sp.]